MALAMRKPESVMPHKLSPLAHSPGSSGSGLHQLHQHNHHHHHQATSHSSSSLSSASSLSATAAATTTTTTATTAAAGSSSSAVLAGGTAASAAASVSGTSLSSSSSSTSSISHISPCEALHALIFRLSDCESDYRTMARHLASWLRREESAQTLVLYSGRSCGKRTYAHTFFGMMKSAQIKCCIENVNDNVVVFCGDRPALVACSFRPPEFVFKDRTRVVVHARADPPSLMTPMQWQEMINALKRLCYVSALQFLSPFIPARESVKPVLHRQARVSMRVFNPYGGDSNGSSVV